MRNLCRTIILILSVVLIGIFCGEEVYAASTSNTNIKNYRIDDCKIVYTKNTGQIVVRWKDSKKQGDKYAELFHNGTRVAFATLENSSWDITPYVQKHGTGTYMATVYPVKIGSDYTEITTDYTVDNSRYAVISEFDQSLYEIMDLWIDYDAKKGIVTGHWDEAEKVTGKSVRLKKGTTTMTNVSGWRTAKEKRYDFSALVAANGAGTYLFEIYSSRLGDSHVVASDVLEIDSEAIKIIKAHVAEVQKEIEGKRIGWYKDGPIVWYYYKNYGEKAKNEWITLEGKTYHFSSAGIMQTGWQAISDKWYYFNSDGSLLKNSVTAEGYRVNADGALVDEKGEPVSSKGQKQSPPVMTTLTSCTISVTEIGKEAGVVKDATFKGGTGFTVDSVTFSKPYEQWKPGDSVAVTAEVNVTANYQFSNTVKFSARNCKSFASTGSTQSRKVTFLYYPKMQLSAPSSLHINGESNLCWKPVQYASRYKVVIDSNDEDEKSTSEIVTEEKYDLSSRSFDQLTEYTIKIYAMASSGKTSYLTTSQEAVITDIEKFTEENTIEGVIKWSDSGMRYTDGDGEKAVGWYQLMGNWYHFQKNGLADGPGWYQDKNMDWFYFDKEHRMCTGEVTVDGKVYFLNDGSVKNKPLGAWVEK